MTSRTDDRADFAVFVAARSQALLRTAYLLTQGRGAAEDLLQTALAKSWQTWGRIDDDPEPYVRAVLVSAYTSWWRRRWLREIATGDLPEVADPGATVGVDEQHALWRALARLPRRQRAVVVLRYLEDLSEGEVARVLGVSVGTVKNQASRALASLRLDGALAAVDDPGPRHPAYEEGTDVAVTESDLPEVFREWADQLAPATDRLGAVDSRIRRHRTRLRVVGAAAVCAAVAVGALVAGHTTTARQQSPAVRRGPSHPALTFPTNFAGSVVSGQVSGSGPQTRSTTLVWPPSERLALAVQCSSTGGSVQIIASSQSATVEQGCVGLDPIFVVDGAEFFPQVESGSVVTLTVSADTGVTGPWAVGVLARDPRWMAGGAPAPTYHGRKLAHWVSGGTSVSASFHGIRADAHPVFVLTCGQAGRLSLLLDGNDVGTVSCADAPWSQQVLPVSQQSLSAAGYVPGRTVSIACGWEGTSWAYVAVAVYAG